MKDITESKFLNELVDTISNMYRLGWNERNGGNISYLLSSEEVNKYLKDHSVKRTCELNFNSKLLAGRYFLVTASGKYFKDIKDNIKESLGVIKISEDGNRYHVMWGFENGNKPTSELPSHLMNHMSRLKVDKENKIVIHCHSTNLLAMTFTVELNEKIFSNLLWKLCTECIIVFPEGIGIIPWMIPGTEEIGIATSNKMLDFRLVLWPYHGVYGTGKNINEAFGLIETAEKAAEVFTKIKSQGDIKNILTDKDLLDLAAAFGVKPRKEFLDI